MPGQQLLVSEALPAQVTEEETAGGAVGRLRVVCQRRLAVTHLTTVDAREPRLAAHLGRVWAEIRVITRVGKSRLKLDLCQPVAFVNLRRQLTENR